MNKFLLNPFDADWPEVFDGALPGTEGTVCASFNRWGTLLAAGTVFGHVVIWDFETRGVARNLHHPAHLSTHPGPIATVSWSDNGCFLLGSGWNFVIQWDVKSNSTPRLVSFPWRIVGAHQHPVDIDLFVVCFENHAPVLARFTLDADASVEVVIESHPDRPKSAPKCAQFSDDGDCIFIGWSQSGLTKHDTKSLALLNAASFPGNGPHTQLHVGVNSTLLLTSHDRVRICDTRTLHVRKDLCDVVNRTQIYSSCLSNNGEYVAAGALHKNSPHSVYIWSVVDGSLVALLDGNSLGVLQLLWHPSIPLLLAVLKSQQIVIWSKNVNRNWSAFAPDFVELHENLIVRDEEEFQALPQSSGIDEIVVIGDPLDDRISTDGVFKYIPVSPKTS